MIEDKLKELRARSNKAIRERYLEGVLSTYLEDIVVISAEGGKLVGIGELEEAWSNIFKGFGPLFERTPENFVVSKDGIRAWENGIWKYDNGQEGGRYAAMWITDSGLWKIRSELFVGLE